MTTSINKTCFNQLIKTFQFKELFNELGWDSVRKKEQIAVENELYTLEAVAEKKGFVAFVCSPENNGKMPDYHIRKKIDSAVTKLYFEHLIIFCDFSQKHQIWQLVIREQGKPIAVRETNYYVHQEPEFLYQKLKGLFFSIDDEEKISIVDVKSLIQEQFNTNAEKVTKRFYDQFKKEHTSFLNFIKGISENVDKDWYASLMLNRLMFIYFIQKKGFLDTDKDYLKNRLKATQEKRGKNKFYSFYRNFLLVLFHKGLGSSERNPEIVNEIGIVPYLNGGLFDVHHIEQDYVNIEIADEAFEQVFRFFDQYEWHLDTRITATGKDINPDVIGYIFEKYINDRASMGAYYTKEDITDYISKNCIIPYLFDEVKRSYPKAFNPDIEIWKLLQTESDKYIYDAVKHGTQHKLPPEIEAGINQISARTAWNKPTPPEYGLPTEIWREVVERRRRYSEIKTKIENGEIHEINDFITYNLNIRQFAQDVIENSDDSEFIKHFYKALLNISILDPTCGSGAFLFAAINVLEPLYEACIQRMEAFVTDAKNSSLERGQRGVSKYKFFQDTLNAVKSPEHPNLQYFIYKNIILNNIYGVDIMHEAVEIAKLRLFLKLMATVDVDYKKPNQGLEPLPDIDFNIRSGNTLVGFTRLEEVEDVVKGSFGKTFLKKEIDAIKEQAEMIKMAYENFKNSQMIIDSPAISGAKRDLEERLRRLNDTLNVYLAKLYEIDIERKPKDFEKWKSIHQPFHWFAEFYEIIHDKGGFDVIIGNPPYVEYSKIRKTYQIKGYQTESCGNLYAFITEQSFRLINKNSKCGLIIPLSLVSTERMNTLQLTMYNSHRLLWLSLFDVYPSKLFEGAKQRLSIMIASHKTQNNIIFTTKYNRWKPEEREFLFQNLVYRASFFNQKLSVIPKINNEIAQNILQKLSLKYPILYMNNSSNISFYVHRIPYNYVKAIDFIPYFWNEKDGEKKSEDYKPYWLNYREGKKRAVLAVLNSNLFFWWWYALFEGYHCGKHEIYAFPVGLEQMPLICCDQLKKLANELMIDIQKNKKIKSCQYKNTGKVRYEEFYPRLSKPIIDKIDKALALHYGFTDEELDFIINYDIKYRMGKELDAED
ncbi:MAG: hypothetical protein JETT_3660 [Candidatus Jettenia ecosi]|uniref:site-specific DNA-methyltransferase (adenine-specific) n=1 Tax=Candidatus Jettenia ecosi TaxID=2494326 RepID=A0A533Q669_9BACT|nr:MAG: hypothetical protein JETT_3660 [Candidatus Jettenia ecosi]